MPTDPNILLYRMSPQVQPISLGEAMLTTAQLEAADQRKAMMRQRQEEMAKASTRENLKNKILSESVVMGANGMPQIDYQGAAKKLADNGFGPEAFDFVKQIGLSRLEQQKAQSEEQKLENERRQRFFKDFEGVTSGALAAYEKNDLQGAQGLYSSARNMLQGLGYNLQEMGIPEQFDPNIVKSARGYALDAKARATNEFQMMQEKNNRAYQQEQINLRKTDQWLTRRGQDLTDARARDTSKAKAEGKAGQGSPQQMLEIDNALNTISEVENHPSFSDAVGMSLKKTLQLGRVPGSGISDFNAAIQPLKSQMFLNAIQKMRGMGQLSNAEGQKVETAIANLDPNQSEKQFKAQLAKLRGYLQSLKDAVSKESGESTVSPAPATDAGLDARIQALRAAGASGAEIEAALKTRR